MTNKNRLKLIERLSNQAEICERLAENLFATYFTEENKSLSDTALRIKNVEVGYTFSTKIVSKIGLSNLRLYCNANNIFTFKNALSPFGIDPETTDTGQSYLFPLTQVVNIGLSMKF